MIIVDREAGVDHAYTSELVDGLPLSLADRVHLLMMRCGDGEMDVFGATPRGEGVGGKVRSGIGADKVYSLDSALASGAGEKMLDGFDDG